MFWSAVLLVTFGVAIDVGTLCLGIRRLRKDGPSGVPVVGLVVVVCGIFLLWLGSEISLDVASNLAKAYVVVHIMLNFGLLLIADSVLRILGK